MKTPFEFPVTAEFDKDNLVQRKPDKVQGFRHGSAACLCVGHVAEKKGSPVSRGKQRRVSGICRVSGYPKREIACGSWALFGSVATTRWVDLMIDFLLLHELNEA